MRKECFNWTLVYIHGESYKQFVLTVRGVSTDCFFKVSPETIKYTPMRWDETNIILVSINKLKTNELCTQQQEKR